MKSSDMPGEHARLKFRKQGQWSSVVVRVSTSTVTAHATTCMMINAPAAVHPAPAIDDRPTLNVGTRDATSARNARIRYVRKGLFATQATSANTTIAAETDTTVKMTGATTPSGENAGGGSSSHTAIKRTTRTAPTAPARAAGAAQAR